MTKLMKIVLITVTLCCIGTFAYGYDELTLEKIAIADFEENYGFNVIFPDGEKESDYNSCILVLEKGLRKLPDGIIKEVTQYYSNNKIATNIILNKTDNLRESFSKYELSEKSADIYVNTLQNNLYNNMCVVSEESFIHEVGQFISDYLFEVYGYDQIKKEFEKLNDGHPYGDWGEDYDEIFICKNSAKSFENEIADLILYAETSPELLRNESCTDFNVKHEKIKYLTSVMKESFLSIPDDSTLWQDALPQTPEKWALDEIEKMKENSLIPEEFEGIYNSYITKEDFYAITLHVVEKKLGSEKFHEAFGLVKEKNSVAIDPIKGEIFIDINKLEGKEKRINEAFEIGLIDEKWVLESKEYITRLEIARLFTYVENELGRDISNYEALNFNDLSDLNDLDKSFVYFALSKGLLEGNEDNFKPYDYTTYQEAYLILLKLYKML